MTNKGADLTPYQSFESLAQRRDDLSSIELLSFCYQLYKLRIWLKGLIRSSSDPNILGKLESREADDMAAYLGEQGSDLIRRLSQLKDENLAGRGLILRLCSWYAKGTEARARHSRDKIEEALRSQIIEDAQELAPVLNFIQRIQEIAAVCRSVSRHTTSNWGIFEVPDSICEEGQRLIDQLVVDFSGNRHLGRRFIFCVYGIQAKSTHGSFAMAAGAIEKYIDEFVRAERQNMSRCAAEKLDEMLRLGTPYRFAAPGADDPNLGE